MVAEISRFIKEGTYFNCKEKKHTILNYFEKTKISAITNASDVDNIKYIDKEKE